MTEQEKRWDFERTLSMVTYTCEKVFGNSYSQDTILECATKIYIEEHRPIFLGGSNEQVPK